MSVDGWTQASPDHDASAQLDEMVYAISHDLHAPVRQVRALVRMVKPEDSHQAHVVSLMKESLRRADDMFQGMLELSRIGRVEHPLAGSPYESLLSSLAEEFLPPAGVTLSVPGAIPRLSGDPGRMRQAVSALVDNALAHGVVDGGNVRVAALEERGFLRVTVVDDGVGMSPRVLGDSGLLFFSNRKRTTRHCGMGLALVKRIAQAYSATFTIASVEGEGTTAELVWPLAQGCE